MSQEHITIPCNVSTPNGVYVCGSQFGHKTPHCDSSRPDVKPTLWPNPGNEIGFPFFRTVPRCGAAHPSVITAYCTHPEGHVGCHETRCDVQRAPFRWSA